MSRACPVCQETAWDKEIHASAPESDGSRPLRLVECRRCGLAYLPDPPPSSHLYSTGYYGQRAGLSRWVFEPFNRFWTGRKARRLLSLGSGRTWLDYGCGRGDLMKALSQQGADVYGIETQPECVGMLSARWKGKVGTSLQDLQLPPETLDGVSFFHVLEHLERPQEILVHLHARAQPKAVLFIAVPNWNAWERSWFGDRWFHLDVPRHLQHFTPANLSLLLAKSGWVTAPIKFSARAYDVFGLFQSLLNLGPGPRNYFYRRLKRGETFKASDQWIGLLWNLVAALPAAAIALSFTPLLACLGRTGTFEAVAIKAALHPPSAHA